MEGGNPTLDAKKYWNSVRRALLRVPIDRIGLGGYLHLVEGDTEFCNYIEKISDEFRLIQKYHSHGKPYVLKPKVAVLTAWGKLRAWTCSGHYHETYRHDLINVIESLSGLALDVEFISFDDIKNGALDNVDVVINAGCEGTAWSGGDYWKDAETVTRLTDWAYHGGAFIGINEPSATRGFDTFFRMAPVLGIDMDTGERICHGKWSFETKKDNPVLTESFTIKAKENLYLIDGNAAVLAQENGIPTVTTYPFGKGMGIYLSSYAHSIENARALLNIILFASGEDLKQKFITSNSYTECAF